jgi:hypothetical protein
MKSRITLSCIAIAMLAIASQATSTRAQTVRGKPIAPSDASVAPILGIWRCQMEGLPAVTLTVTDEGGTLTGAVLFYLHRRAPGQAVTATPGVPEPLFNPIFDGKALTFQVSHRRAHPPGSLEDAPVTFQVKLDSAGNAQLLNESANDPKAPVYVLVKSAY